MERKINISTQKVNSKSEITIDNDSDCFKTLTIKQHFENEEKPLEVIIQMDILNKQIEINGISLNKVEIALFKEFIDQLRLNQI